MALEQPLSASSPSARYYLKTFGRLELLALDNPQQQRLPVSGKSLALLAFLNGAARHVAHRARLAEVLWSSVGAEGALQSLRQARFGLRRVAGVELILLEGDDLVLSPFITTDRDEFEGAISSGDLLRAIQLYHGPFCEGFAAAGADEFERWAAVERASLRSKCAEAIVRVAGKALAEARATEALALAERLSTVDEDDERHWRLRLEALLLKHDGFSSITVARACESWLEREGREPSKLLRQLLQRAAQALGPAMDAGSTGSGAFGLHPDLIGREAQFSAVLSAWQATSQGRGITVLVTGASGLGKTRLLRDVAERLLANRARVANVRALPADRELPFALIARVALALASMRGAAGLSSASAAVLTALNPALGAFFRSEGAPQRSDDTSVAYVEALDELLGVLSEESRLAVIVDDLHWADQQSALVLASLGERQANRRVLLIVAMRTRASARTPTPSGASLVSVDPLSLAESEALIASIARLSRSTDSDWVARLHQACGGNPLLTLESLRLAMAAGCISVVDETWQVADLTALNVICDKRSAIADRLSKLDAEARGICRVIAVAGRPLPETSLAQASVLPHGASVLKALEIIDVLAHEPGGWVLAHDALADALIASSVARELEDASLQVANILRQSTDQNGLRAALRLFEERHLEDDCADVITRAITQEGAGAREARRRAQGLLNSIVDSRLRHAVRMRLPYRLRIDVVQRVVGLVALLLLVTIAAISPRFMRAASDASPDMEVYLVSQGSPVPEVRLAQLRFAEWPFTDRINSGDRVMPWPSAGVNVQMVSPRDGTIAIERFYQDSGQVDVALWYADRHEKRLTATRGDDVPTGWSPDGRDVLVESSREGELGHRAIFRVDVETGAARRITSGGSRFISDRDAQWSPDGTHIAFSRVHFDRHVPELCVVDVDGTSEHCFILPERSFVQFGGWLDSDHLLVTVDRGGRTLTESMAVTDSSFATIGDKGNTCTASPDGRWLACRTRRGQLTLAPTSNPVGSHPVAGRVGVPTLAVWKGQAIKMPYVDRIEIQPLAGDIPIGVPVSMRATAFTSAGEPLEGVSFRWRVVDSSMGRALGNGQIVALKPGHLRVECTAGGWRTRSVNVNASTSHSRAIAQVDWSEDDVAKWRFFGTPLPAIVRTSSQRAFWNHGDGDHVSGAYLRKAFALDGGAWLEADLSTPITVAQWQTVMLLLSTPTDNRALAAWDHRSGGMPGDQTFLCTFVYPRGEGYGALQRISPGGDVSVRLGFATERLASGEWYRVLIQLMPDGRCALAINGRPLAILGTPRTLPDSATVIVQGNSQGTQVLVGHLSVGVGIRTDVSWLSLATDPRP